MGVLLSKLYESKLGVAAGSVTEIISGRRKRKRDDNDYLSCADDNERLEKTLSTPKKIKLQSTAQYIYKTLYKEEKNSDITVGALGRMWHLHKIYLCQSPYFQSMFNGMWREATENFVSIEIVDPKITLEALDVVFGSLYLDEVNLDPKAVVSVLATASLFQLDGLTERCADVMMENVNIETVIVYNEAATQYNVKSVIDATIDWLMVNLLSFYAKQKLRLRDISLDLLTKLIISSELFVMQTEYSLYNLVRLWTYLQINTELTEADEPKIDEYAQAYFKSREDKTPFVLTQLGQMYENPFKVLRLTHLLNHPIDLKVLVEDNIIPKNWLLNPLLLQWNSMLLIDQSQESGSSSIDPIIFEERCIRYGRVLPTDDFQKWRWTGFCFGLDLVLASDCRVLSVRRHHRRENERLLSLQVKRKFHIRVTLVSLNEQRQVKYKQSTGIVEFSLVKNEEVPLIHMDRQLKFPILVSVNLLVVSPNTQIANYDASLIAEQKIYKSIGCLNGTMKQNSISSQSKGDK